MALYENTINLKGFLGKDAETRNTKQEHSFIVLSLATKSSYKDKQSSEWVSHTEWHRIVCFGKSAEFAKELKKGDYVEVKGELRSSEFESDNGEKPCKRRSWEIRASRVEELAPPSPSERNINQPPTRDEAA
jgi:single-strand DNA-binding protein